MAEMLQVISVMAGVAAVFAALGYVNRRGARFSAPDPGEAVNK
ncbi:MAG: hypothetical protein QOI25_2021 [Mycobacterium sp.]|jgi:hypothetical protein|nr:hypothetical protein [Mycobacterium sp.]MDT5324081.1 hypothetical protein [Mycobacterium sp.]